MRILSALIWKDLMMTKRDKLNTVFRMTYPLFLMLFALYYRKIVGSKIKEEKFLDYKTTAPRCILYTPKSKLAGILMREVGKQLGLSRLTAIPHKPSCNGYYPYSNYSEITKLVESFPENESVFLINFEDMDAKTWSSRRQDRLTYTIQINNKFNKRSYTSRDVILPPTNPHGEIHDDFIRIQRAIHVSYIKVTMKKAPQKLFVNELPHFRDDDTDIAKLRNRMKDKLTASILCFYGMIISALTIFTHIMSRMLTERVTGIQELIKMNAVSPTSLSIAYFITSIPPALSLSVGNSILMKITNRPIIEYTSGIYTFVGLALYAVSLLAFGMACSYVMNNSRFVTGISILIYIATIVLIKYVIFSASENRILIMLSGMMLHVPLYWIFNEIFMNEFYRKPLTFSDLNSKLYYHGSVIEGYIFLSLQSLMYFALAWYLSYVRLGQYGNSLPWNFPCRKKVDESAIIAAFSEVPEERDNRYFEEPPKGKDVGIKIINVSKYYPKPALSDVSLDVYKGEITILLGHNGAGKTTLISIITGMTTPSQGKVLVNGLETVSNSLQVRKQIGLCTQHNLFIENLNVIEHVMFFNMLKGKSVNIRADSQELLNKLGIGNKASASTEELSGGMKRRLQLSCALAGGSNVLVLDEPTSGLDVETRRELWDLLLSLRGERTVLLSTHFMEEADALGDRVAALHTGHLRCHATPMYLKKAMGGGYRLSLTTSGHPKKEKINALVKQHVGGAVVREELMNTITYNMPSSETSHFPRLFAALENNRDALEIDTIGVGVSTMEEVFLFICSDSETFIKEGTVTDMPASEYGKIKGINLYKRQVIVLLRRHLNFLRENIIAFSIIHIIAPGLLMYIFSHGFNNIIEKEEPVDLMHKPRSERSAPYSTAYRHQGLRALNLLSNVIAPHLMLRGFTTSHAQPLDDDDKLPEDNGAKGILNCVLWAVLVGWLILFPSYNLHTLPVIEGESGARHLHVMAGCPVALHWLLTLGVHTLLSILTVVPIAIICAYICDNDNTFTNARFLLTLGLILIIGIMAFFGLVYFLDHCIDKTAGHGLATNIIICGGLLSLVKVLQTIEESEYSPLEYGLVVMASLWPPFTMTVGIAQAAYIARLNALCEIHIHDCPNLVFEDRGFDEDKCCAGESTAYISFEEWAPGMRIIILVVQGFVFMALVILKQMGYMSCICDKFWNRNFKAQPASHVDELVAAEATRADQEIQLPEQQMVDHNKALLVSHLHKNYAGPCSQFYAVKGISFSVKKGECFGLLGLNGAGKSTTFKMLTTEVCPTLGRVFANGIFLHKQKKEFLRKIGYCPQFLGIDDFQTANDNLRTLLTIRGLDDNDIDKEIKAWIAVVGLEKYANMTASRYSGGYKRRLAAAAALCSGAPLSLLDEPTAGVDVGARRLVHAALRKALSLGDSIVITSHSMDEMEALCTRIAILSAGRIRALGTSSELRSKYAQGYALVLKVKPKHDDASGGQSPMDKLKHAVTQIFNCVLRDEHMTMLHYHIKDKITYSDIFSKLENLRNQYPDIIEDYSVNETTLEEVFIHLAKEQAAEEAALEVEKNKGKEGTSGTTSQV